MIETMAGLGRLGATGARASVLVAIGLPALLALAGCAQSVAGELSVTACTNGEDDDGDGRSDCDDSDCWVYCPRPSDPNEIGDASSSFDSGPRLDASAAPKDGSAVDSAQGDDDTGMPLPADPEDGGAEPVCDCGTEQMCDAGACVPRSLDGVYRLRVKSALVPMTDSRNDCYDYARPTCPGIPIGCSECEAPDPRVVVWLNGAPVSAATTAATANTISPTWPNAPEFELTLRKSDTLIFFVVDDDDTRDQEMFRCTPDLSSLPSQFLSCSPAAGMTQVPPTGVRYLVTVDAMRAPAPP